MHKKRWKWSDAGSNEPVLRSPINRQQLEQQFQKEETEQIHQQPEPPSEPLDNFNDDKHVRGKYICTNGAKGTNGSNGNKPILKHQLS